jgi:hypothetical protein
MAVDLQIVENQCVSLWDCKILVHLSSKGSAVFALQGTADALRQIRDRIKVTEQPGIAIVIIPHGSRVLVALGHCY